MNNQQIYTNVSQLEANSAKGALGNNQLIKNRHSQFGGLLVLLDLSSLQLRLSTLYCDNKREKNYEETTGQIVMNKKKLSFLSVFCCS